MAAILIDTFGWTVVVPCKRPLDLAGSQLAATVTGEWGGVVATLDSTSSVPGYDDAREIGWTADPVTGLTDHVVLILTRARRGGWRATDRNGAPGPVTLFADVGRTMEGSVRDPEPLGRTAFRVTPGTSSPAVAARGAGPYPVLTALPPGSGAVATALQVGPQGKQGETGPPGPPSPVERYEHVQASPAAVWTVAHNLGARPVVTVLSPGGVLMLAGVQHLSANTLQVVLDDPQAGLAVCV